MDASLKKDFNLKIKKEAVKKWKQKLLRLQPHHSGFRVCEIIVPYLEEWVFRKHGYLTFHMTQLISGHGCFNDFLHKINKSETPICAHCKLCRDTANHTLMECTSWFLERRNLTAVIGMDIDLHNIIGKIITDKDCWKAFATFCTRVMTRKEIAERERQQQEI